MKNRDRRLEDDKSLLASMFTFRRNQHYSLITLIGAREQDRTELAKKLATKRAFIPYIDESRSWGLTVALVLYCIPYTVVPPHT